MSNKHKSGPVYSKKDFNLEGFLSDMSAFRQGKTRYPPWCYARSEVATDRIARDVFFTFADNALAILESDPYGMKKDLTSALTYGFIGATRGGRNGIVPVRESDARLQRRIEGYIRTLDPAELQSKYGINIENSEGVKIVVHRKNGLRTIGIRDTQTNHIVFFDQKTYNI